MNARKFLAGMLVALLLLIGIAAVIYAECGKCSTCDTAAKKVVKAQTLCPVSGKKIDKKAFVDVKRYRVYLCCPGCTGSIKSPEFSARSPGLRSQRPVGLGLGLFGGLGFVDGGRVG